MAGPPFKLNGMAQQFFHSRALLLSDKFINLNMGPQRSSPIRKSYKHPDSDVWYAFLTSLIPTHGPCIERFTDNLSALQALITALNDLDTLCETIEGAYDASLKNDEIERWDEKS